jgi:hypothetical protein
MDMSLVRMSRNECGVSKCDREASIMLRFGPLRDITPCKKKFHSRNYKFIAILSKLNL